jgi:hypothetical protein
MIDLHYNLSMKEGRQFVYFVLFVLMRSIELGCFKLCFWSLWKVLFGKLSRRRGASTWFSSVWTCGVEIFEY